MQLTSPGETSDSLESDIFLLHRSAAPNSFLAFAHSTLQSVLADKNSRTIFYFLCVNLGKFGGGTEGEIYPIPGNWCAYEGRRTDGENKKEKKEKKREWAFKSTTLDCLFAPTTRMYHMVTLLLYSPHPTNGLFIFYYSFTSILNPV